MVSALVQRFRADTAPRLLERFSNGGTQAVIQSTVMPDDPLEFPISVSTEADVNAYVSGVGASILTTDPNLTAADLQVLVAAVDFTPVVGEYVKVNGKARAILRVDAIPAAGDPAAYKFFVR